MILNENLNKEEEPRPVDQSESKTSWRHSVSLLLPGKDYFVTPLIMYANVLVFIMMVIDGVDTFEPSVEALIGWGGNLRSLTLNGETWRLLTSVFLHGGIIHLLFNMFALLQLGAILETSIGKPRYLLIYVATGILASLTSIAINENIVSVGASGAIFGLNGLLLALLITKQLRIPQDARKSLLNSTLIFIGYNLFFGFTKEGIDNAAHIGGLISGLLIGMLYSPTLKRGERSTLASGIVAAVVIIAVVLAPRIISNKAGEYDAVMKSFAANEERALWMYNEDLPAKQSEVEQYSQRLNTEGIDLWKENLTLLSSLKDMPVYLQNRVDLLTVYCQLRIQSCEAIQRYVRDPAAGDAEITELNAKIGEVIAQLEKLNNE